MTNKVLSVLVYNHSGVLARVSSLFARRGFNIDSLTVSATNDPEISRITISVRGDAQVIDQILSQTFKLEETRTVFCLEEGKSLFRELLLVKVKATETTRSAISEVARIYGGHVVDLSVGSMIVELTGIPTKIDAFLNVIGEYGGIGLPLEGHLWQPDQNWGYVRFKNAGEVTDEHVRYAEMLERLIPTGCSGAVYTQTTDVEIEVNGLMTYDRKRMKVDERRLHEVNQRLCRSLGQ